ncbi:hypothetical protein NDU88_005073 [Pleurodeles waltl]|uniref:Uncharacterized protein n=1 Tax=Pleurodeles waltl TaxID=8319 RepID=A0AAV7NR64_PLEWA|nr:hypothetical protein NDU88_005073 [Pleurodeles waltl]
MVCQSLDFWDQETILQVSRAQDPWARRVRLPSNGVIIADEEGDKREQARRHIDLEQKNLDLEAGYNALPSDAKKLGIVIKTGISFIGHGGGYPGLKGLLEKYLKKMAQRIAGPLHELYLSAYETGKLLRDLHTATIVLIPKVGEPQEHSDETHTGKSLF